MRMARLRASSYGRAAPDLGAAAREDPAALVTLERPALRHADEFLSSVRRSRSLHRGLVSPPQDFDGFRRYVNALRHRSRAGFLVSSLLSREIFGVVNVSEIVGGNFRSAYLGYYAFTPFAGRGLMRAGVAKVVDYCFADLRLHRLEANIQPENERSIRLVQRLGFRLEGFSPRYLKVCGRWRDHQRWAVLADEWHSAAPTIAEANGSVAE